MLADSWLDVWLLPLSGFALSAGTLIGLLPDPPPQSSPFSFAIAWRPRANANAAPASERTLARATHGEALARALRGRSNKKRGGGWARNRPRMPDPWDTRMACAVERDAPKSATPCAHGDTIKEWLVPARPPAGPPELAQKNSPSQLKAPEERRERKRTRP